MTASIARYLKDFGEPPPAPVFDAEPAGFDLGHDIFDIADPLEVPLDLEAERAAARAEGHAAAEEEAGLRWGEERETLLRAHAEEIAALRQKHEDEMADIVAQKLAEASLLIAEAVSTQTAQILAPLVEEALVDKAVSEMAALIRAAVAEGDLGAVVVHGPARLFGRLAAAFGEEGASLLRHVEAADLDITVDLGDSALVTRMSAWSARLRKVLA